MGTFTQAPKHKSKNADCGMMGNNQEQGTAQMSTNSRMGKRNGQVHRHAEQTLQCVITRMNLTWSERKRAQKSTIYRVLFSQTSETRKSTF